MDNFQEMTDVFIRERGAFQAASPSELENHIVALLESPSFIEEWGRSARRVAESQRGALEKS